MNVFEQKTKKIEEYFMDWDTMYPTPYDKDKVSPWTKVRVILMNGTEFESNWFLHNFARHCSDEALKRDLALVRRQEQQQQKRISCLKPINESVLEETIGYEQLAIELTAILAQNEDNMTNKAALDFALLEDFDHLYRFANMLKADYDIDAKRLVGGYTEIMPGRPTIAEHRHPYDSIRKGLVNKQASDYSKLVASIITAAEQQTMNFYMNMAQTYKTDIGRRLYQEIGMIEEQHVSQYESLQDASATWLECWVMHEYTECYLYYSMIQGESCEHIKKIWQEHLDMEIAHLHMALEYLKKYENKTVKDLFESLEMPKPLLFGENKEYIRDVIEKTVYNTAILDKYVDVREHDNARFDQYQNAIQPNDNDACHQIVEDFIKRFGNDYRYQDSEHPIEALRETKHDNICVGRKCG